MRAAPRKVSEAVAQAAHSSAEKPPRPWGGVRLLVSDLRLGQHQRVPQPTRQPAQRCLSQLDQPAHALDPGRRGADAPQRSCRARVAGTSTPSRSRNGRSGSADTGASARSRRGRRGRRRPAAVRGHPRGSRASPVCRLTNRRVASAMRPRRRAPGRRGRERHGALSARSYGAPRAPRTRPPAPPGSPGTGRVRRAHNPNVGGAASSSARAAPSPRSARWRPSSPDRRGRPADSGSGGWVDEDVDIHGPVRFAQSLEAKYRPFDEQHARIEVARDAINDAHQERNRLLGCDVTAGRRVARHAGDLRGVSASDRDRGGAAVPVGGGDECERRR